MPRTTSRVGAPRGLPGSESSASIDPSWQPWLDLLGIALAEAADPAWGSMLRSVAERPSGAPLVEGAALAVDSARANDLARRLAAAAGILASSNIDAVAMIRATIHRDHEATARAAEQVGVSCDLFAVVAQLAALPLLHGCARTLSAEATRVWERGYCPVCGAWPALAELRGIQRERWLRCACCGADWPLAVLRCAFCDETDHRRLGSFVMEEEPQLRIETCESCRSYLKSVTSLSALPLERLALTDLSTVPLDLVAHERGYARPAHVGWRSSVGFVA